MVWISSMSRGHQSSLGQTFLLYFMFPCTLIHEPELCNRLLKSGPPHSWRWTFPNTTLPTTAATGFKMKCRSHWYRSCFIEHRPSYIPHWSLSLFNNFSLHLVRLSYCYVSIDELFWHKDSYVIEKQFFCDFVTAKYHQNIPHFCGNFLLTVRSRCALLWVTFTFWTSFSGPSWKHVFHKMMSP